jgi:hypothetical protein
VEGIKSASGLLFDAVAQLASDMIESIKQALGIASPSKRGIAIGDNFVNSIGLGGMQALQDVERTFAMMSNRLALASAGGFSSGPSAVDQSVNSNFEILGNVIIQGNTTPESFGGQVKARRF